MTQPKPSDSVMAAASEIMSLIVQLTNKEIGKLSVEQLVTIIDRETGLPKMQARIEELEMELLTLITFSADLQHRLEAEKAELLKTCKALIDGLDEYWITLPEGVKVVEHARAAIAETEGKKKA